LLNRPAQAAQPHQFGQVNAERMPELTEAVRAWSTQ
jgi:hypothetical protein